MPELGEIADDVIRYLQTEEGQSALVGQAGKGVAWIHNDKMQRRLLDTLGRGSRIHVEKFAAELLHDLRHAVGRRGGDPWVRVPAAFGAYYMTLLAARLAATRGRALLTDEPSVEKLASKARLGCELPHRAGLRVPAKVAEGLLGTLALRTIRIGSGTSVAKLLRFREKHEIERARFRSAIRSLVESLSGDAEAEPLARHVQTLFQDKVLPSLDDLRGRLRDHRITCGFSNLKLSTLAATSPTALGGVLLQAGLGPFALFAGVGLSVVLQTANYGVQKRQILRSNPYSFVLCAERTLGRNKR